MLVNCVGIFDFYRGLADIDDDQLDAAFDEMFAVNVKSQLVCVRAALPELRRAGGSVVLTVSTSGFYPGRGGILYVASKFAVRGCVIALAHELAPEVRVNGVAPGGTLGTELTGPRSLGLAGQVLGAAPGREEDLRRRTPLQVALTGEDHAGSYVFLASDRARGITGTVVHSDGGVGVGVKLLRSIRWGCWSRSVRWGCATSGCRALVAQATILRLDHSDGGDGIAASRCIRRDSHDLEEQRRSRYRVTFRRENAIVQGSARWRSSSGMAAVTEGDRPPGLANLRS